MRATGYFLDKFTPLKRPLEIPELPVKTNKKLTWEKVQTIGLKDTLSYILSLVLALFIGFLSAYNSFN